MRCTILLYNGLRICAKERDMRAEETRKIADAYRNNEPARELDWIFGEIEERAKLGHEDYVTGQFFKKETIEFLKGSGYTITIEDTPGYVEFTNIKW
jgi:hypothetical protein